MQTDIFVTKKFHDQLNSIDLKKQKRTSEEIALWIITTHFSFFFQETWVKDGDNIKKVLEYLHQYIIQVFN